MVQIVIGDIWPILAVIVIPIFIYFIKLELRMRKVEELEGKLSVEFRVQKLESDPVFMTLKQLTVEDAIALYTSASKRSTNT